MKNVILISAFLCLLLACSKEDLGTVSAYLGQEIKLKEGQSALYNSNGSEGAPAIKLKVEEVRDSRCPSDVVCITYGSVEVKLSLGTMDSSYRNITMCLGDCGKGGQWVDEAVVPIGAIPYKVRLLDVTPLPKHSDQKRVTKEVQLVLERL
ncbi:hypothetical protein [Pontibacter ramchanderi]|uniref:Lipoprotein n=1 Tax=Pontibacter ramchanderi TaxID=1179743 RepID=A0A2N3UAJ5_9BACT|nr:hypothetical protein [Pontibacter ramchanderi]PKV66404.1 hypothetical protein BD749_1531 [Pontibacter ramchanderi]